MNRNGKPSRRPYVAYLAVLPAYRSDCIDALHAALDPSVRLFASSAHLDRTVKTGIRTSQYTSVPMWRIGGKVFLQWGNWGEALRASATIVDLNPRSLTAWSLLALRLLLKRRTLVWGHLHPRAGHNSPSARLRRSMRRVAAGTITYTYDQARDAKRELPQQPVWVAPNSLYRRSELEPIVSGSTRSDVIYVGRLVKEKKVDLLLEGFAVHAKEQLGTRLVIVGDGDLRVSLQERAEELSLSDRVLFHPATYSTEELRSHYSSAFASASPGFVGLGLTQSLGFGVPQIYSANEPHSPEIELATRETATPFTTDNPSDLASAISNLFATRNALPLTEVVDRIRTYYSAEAMAEGIVRALKNQKDWNE